MNINDPIADLLTRIRNAGIARHMNTYCPWSKIKETIVSILKAEGYISDFGIEEIQNRKFIQITLRYYAHNKNVISEIKRESTPGCRRYVASKEIPNVKNGMGLAILSTPKGILTGKQAKAQNLGGELLCSVW